jgi:hypothetical protein
MSKRAFSIQQQRNVSNFDLKNRFTEQLIPAPTLLECEEICDEKCLDDKNPFDCESDCVADCFCALECRKNGDVSS